MNAVPRPNARAARRERRPKPEKPTKAEAKAFVEAEDKAPENQKPKHRILEY